MAGANVEVDGLVGAGVDAEGGDVVRGGDGLGDGVDAAHASGSLLLSMLPGGLALPVWLLVRGVDVGRWDATAG